MRRIDTAERRLRLAQRHHLHTPSHDVVTVAANLVGLHSSDPATVYLSAWARLDEFHVTDLASALYEQRTLLRVLGMRRTMFVVTHDVASTITVACTRDFIDRERKRLIGWLEEQNIAADGESWLRTVEAGVLASLDQRGEATAVEIKADVPELEAKIVFGEGKTWGGTVGVSTRVLFLLATSGLIVRARPKGSWISSQYRWTTTTSWVPGWSSDVDPLEAERDLVTRWLRTYGPGTETDLVWWTGWGKRRTHKVLADIGAAEVELDERTGYVLPDDVDAPPPTGGWVALLPSLDSTVMGWKERSWYLGPHATALYDRNGNAGPTVWVDGRIVGGWGHRADGEIVYELLEDVGTDAERMIAGKAAELASWLGDVRIKARFPTPLEKSLIG
ncbi:MAG TPA: winged helix DNA-binding domain-containing protein [Acidimicrobiia bacterium]|jgi:hypothetical protein|nr:winged helix DNA-binding domain-containing protein [Acidimicrobiia bacterium]